MPPLNWKVMTWSLGLFTALTFVLCVVYGLVMPGAPHMTQLLSQPHASGVSVAQRRQLHSGAHRDVPVRRLRRTCVHRHPQRRRGRFA